MKGKAKFLWRKNTPAQTKADPYAPIRTTGVKVEHRRKRKSSNGKAMTEVTSEPEGEP